MRLKRHAIGLVLGLLSALFLSGLATADTKVWTLVSPVDSYNHPDINPYYDIDFLSAAEWADDIVAKNNLINFWIFLKTPVTKNMFNDNQGSWASLYFDYDGDGTDEISIEISGISFRESSYSTSIWLKSTSAGSGIGKCGATTWTNLEDSATWIGIEFDKVCAGLPNSFYVDGYVDYINADSRAFDYLSDWFVTLPNTAPTTTTTIPQVQIPNAPTSVSISQTSVNSLRVTWLDNSSNEDGFLIQRNDTPVPAGTPISSWPYKSAVNSPSFDATNLTPNLQYCFAISSYNSAGSSAFTESSCFNLVAANTPNESPTLPQSLSCDAKRVRFTKSAARIRVDTGAANAGKKITYEAFKSGKWIKIGQGRSSGQGKSVFTASIKIVGKKGPMPIRGTQGSRFICEGTLR